MYKILACSVSIITPALLAFIFGYMSGYTKGRTDELKRWIEKFVEGKKGKNEISEFKLNPCPFCMGATEVITDQQGYYGVSCIHCDYTSERYEQSIHAIEAHNLVSSAVNLAKSIVGIHT